jgi:hypothetical protein
MSMQFLIVCSLVALATGLPVTTAIAAKAEPVSDAGKVQSLLHDITRKLAIEREKENVVYDQIKLFCQGRAEVDGDSDAAPLPQDSEQQSDTPLDGDIEVPTLAEFHPEMLDSEDPSLDIAQMNSLLHGSDGAKLAAKQPETQKSLRAAKSLPAKLLHSVHESPVVMQPAHAAIAKVTASSGAKLAPKDPLRQHAHQEPASVAKLAPKQPNQHRPVPVKTSRKLPALPRAPVKQLDQDDSSSVDSLATVLNAAVEAVTEPSAPTKTFATQQPSVSTPAPVKKPLKQAEPVHSVFWVEPKKPSKPPLRQKTQEAVDSLANVVKAASEVASADVIQLPVDDTAAGDDDGLMASLGAVAALRKSPAVARSALASPVVAKPALSSVSKTNSKALPTQHSHAESHSTSKKVASAVLSIDALAGDDADGLTPAFEAGQTANHNQAVKPVQKTAHKLLPVKKAPLRQPQERDDSTSVESLSNVLNEAVEAVSTNDLQTETAAKPSKKVESQVLSIDELAVDDTDGLTPAFEAAAQPAKTVAHVVNAQVAAVQDELSETKNQIARYEEELPPAPAPESPTQKVTALSAAVGSDISKALPGGAIPSMDQQAMDLDVVPAVDLDIGTGEEQAAQDISDSAPATSGDGFPVPVSESAMEQLAQDISDSAPPAFLQVTQSARHHLKVPPAAKADLDAAWRALKDVDEETKDALSMMDLLRQTEETGTASSGCTASSGGASAGDQCSLLLKKFEHRRLVRTNREAELERRSQELQQALRPSASNSGKTKHLRSHP